MKKHAARGKINIGCLFLIVLLIAGSYVGFKFGKVYLSQYLFKRQLLELSSEVAKDYTLKMYPSNTDIVNAVIEEARKLSVELTPENIEIVRRDDHFFVIKVTWEEEVVLPYYTHYFTFEFNKERNIAY